MDSLMESNKRIDELIAKSSKALETFRTTFKELNKVHNYEDAQTWDDLIEIPDGTAINLDGNSCVKLHTENGVMTWLTTMPPAGSFKPHWHDCDERCLILHGVLADKLNPETYVKKDEEVWFKAGAENRHTPYNPKATDYTKIIVTFYKNED